MAYKRFADLMAVFHFLWFAFAFAALPLAVFGEGIRPFVLLFLIVTVVSWFIWGGCPLRIWENELRMKHDPRTTYEGSFFSHYFKKAFGIHIPTMAVTVAINAYLVVLVFVSI